MAVYYILKTVIPLSILSSIIVKGIYSFNNVLEEYKYISYYNVFFMNLCNDVMLSFSVQSYTFETLPKPMLVTA